MVRQRGKVTRTRDGLGLASLSDRVHCETHAHSHGQRVAALVNCKQEARAHRGCQIVQHERVLASQRAACVEPAPEHREDACTLGMLVIMLVIFVIVLVIAGARY